MQYYVSSIHEDDIWQIFWIGTVRYAEGLWRMRRHGPVIVHCTDSEDFPDILSTVTGNPNPTVTESSTDPPAVPPAVPIPTHRPLTTD